MLQLTKPREADKISGVPGFPAPPDFYDWKQKTVDAVCACAAFQQRCFTWLLEVEEYGKSFEDFANPSPFSQLDAKLNTALDVVIP